MKLSYKATQFIVEAIEYQIASYQKRLEEIENIDEDEASDISNDCVFLEALRNDLLESLQSGKLPQEKANVESGLGGLSWQELVEFIRGFSISDRLFLVDAINKSIREEISSEKKWDALGLVN
ncbi:MAG: hypothetical protein F6K39_25030 [Okeania sp. SIO3B3]|nr:hypothetical protein [Okeania sp. SIO3B3]